MKKAHQPKVRPLASADPKSSAKPTRPQFPNDERTRNVQWQPGQVRPFTPTLFFDKKINGLGVPRKIHNTK
jgi:hypothetical protein